MGWHKSVNNKAIGDSIAFSARYWLSSSILLLKNVHREVWHARGELFMGREVEGRETEPQKGRSLRTGRIKRKQTMYIPTSVSFDLFPLL